jgi:hypothetical protein
MTPEIFREYKSAVLADLILSSRRVDSHGRSLFVCKNGMRHGLLMSHGTLRYLRASIGNIVPNYVAEGWDALFQWEEAAGVDVWRHLHLDFELLLPCRSTSTPTSAPSSTTPTAPGTSPSGRTP